MAKFRCIKSWARNKIGDVVMDYTYRRYPETIKKNNFELAVEEKKAVEVKKSEPVVKEVAKKEPKIDVEAPKSVPEPKKFTGYSKTSKKD
jgi:hypothetical protein